MFLQGAKALNKIYLCSNSHQSSKFHFLNMQSNKYKLGLINIQMPANTVTTHFKHLAWSLQHVQSQSLQFCLNSTCLTCHKELFDSLKIKVRLCNHELSVVIFILAAAQPLLVSRSLPYRVFREMSNLADMSNLWY